MLNKAAKQGLVESQFILGEIYNDGKVVPRNYKKAVLWWQKAAQQGCMGSQFQLGIKYYLGESVTQNYRTSMKWFKKAEEQGHVDAKSAIYQLSLSVLLKSFNYDEELINKGICCGIACMGMKAIFSQQVTYFDKMFEYIVEHIQKLLLVNTNFWFLNIKFLYYKLMGREDLFLLAENSKNQDRFQKENEALFIDVRALLDGIALHHSLRKHKELFEIYSGIDEITATSMTLNSNSSSRNIQMVSDIISKKTKPLQLLQMLGICSKEYLEAYFIEFGKAINESSYQNPICMLIESMQRDIEQHIITIGYYNNQWILFDSNNLSTRYLETLEKVVQSVDCGLYNNDNFLKIIDLKIYAPEQENTSMVLDILQYTMHKFKKLSLDLIAKNSYCIDFEKLMKIVMTKNDADYAYDLLYQFNAIASSGQPTEEVDFAKTECVLKESLQESLPNEVKYLSYKLEI